MTKGAGKCTHQHRSKDVNSGGKGDDVGELDWGGFRLRQSFLSLAAVKGAIRRMSERAGSFHLCFGSTDLTGDRYNSCSPSILGSS